MEQSVWFVARGVSSHSNMGSMRTMERGENPVHPVAKNPHGCLTPMQTFLVQIV
jgi:hypothetical protein